MDLRLHFPKIMRGSTVVDYAALTVTLVLLIDALEAYVFGYLSVGVLSVQEAAIQRLHSVYHLLVTVFEGCCQIPAIPK